MVAFEAMENEGKKGLDGEEEVEVQQKKLEEEVRKGFSKGERSSLSTVSFF